MRSSSIVVVLAVLAVSVNATGQRQQFGFVKKAFDNGEKTLKKQARKAQEAANEAAAKVQQQIEEAAAKTQQKIEEEARKLKEAADKAAEQAEKSAKSAAAALRNCKPGNFYTAPLSCEKCASGRFTTESGQAECKATQDCPAGKYVSSEPSPSSNRVCSVCAAGHFSTTKNAASCTEWQKCTAKGSGADPNNYEGTTTSDRVCSPCDLGTTFSEDHPYGGFVCSALTPCQTGQWESVLPTTSSDRKCQDHSLDCPYGMFTIVGGEPVNANHDVSESGRDRICQDWTNCMEGEYESTSPSSTSNRVCERCSHGRFKDQAGNKAPCAPWKNCKLGDGLEQEGDAAQDRVCKECPFGKFSDTVNGAQCQAWSSTCQPGTYTAVTANNFHDRKCTRCAEGRWSGESDVSSCEPLRPCVPGKYVTNLADLTLNQQLGRDVNRECAQCPPEHFSTMNNAASCTPFDNCAPGTYVSTTPSATRNRICAPCPEDTFSDTVNAAFCKPWSTCPTGNFVSTTPSAENDRGCTPCPDQTFSQMSNSATCTDWETCLPGNFVKREPSAVRNRQCDVCPKDTFSAMDNSAMCTPQTKCGKGMRISPDSTTEPRLCNECPDGEYQDATEPHRLEDCEVHPMCVAGEFMAKNLKTERRTCSECSGDLHYQSQSSHTETSCVEHPTCPPGTFMSADDKVAARKCSKCPGGQYQSGDDHRFTTCIDASPDCSPGYWMNAPLTSSSDRKCAKCADGKFTVAPGERACSDWKKCSVGEGLSREGSYDRDRECAACVPGVTFSNVIDHRPCSKVREPCPPGQHTKADASPSTDLVCAPNPDGTFTPTAGLATATVWSTCPAGEGMDMEGTDSTDRTCKPCELGKSYSPVDDGERCRAVREPCPPGEYMSKAETLSSDRVCSPCAAGYFKSGSGNEACVKWSTCPIGEGMTTEGTGTTDRQCDLCDTVDSTHHPRVEGGFFSDDNNGDACQPVRTCDKDEYQTEAPTASSDRVCATHRDSCPVGQWTSTGVSEHSDRICSIVRTCAPGKYQTAAPGASSNRECSECGIGTYQDKPNELQCEMCAAGKHRNAKVASSVEAVACSACAIGKFQNSDGQTSCKECAAGRVQPEPHKMQCVQCGMGKYQPEEGKTSCHRCVVGKFRSSTPASSYEPEACVTCTNRQYTITYKAVQDDTCKIEECPVDMVLRGNKCVRDGGWTAWGAWSLCDHDGESDALGSAKRTRTCTQPTPLNGGIACKGPSTETRGCRNGGWTEWGTRRNRKGGCTKTCGGGKQWRFCRKPVPLHGKACEGPTEQTCNDFSCTPSVACEHMTCTHSAGMIQVNHHHKDHEAGHLHHHCMFDGSLSDCKCLCNKVHGVPHHLFAPIREELRKVDNDPHSIYAARTSGLKQATPAPTPPQVYGAEELLSATPNSIDGGWANWSPWSKCRPDTKDMVRVRSCTNPWPEHGGMPCDGANEETKPCASPSGAL